MYDLKVETYNKLVEWSGGLAILIVFKLPEAEEEWLTVNEDVLCLKNCCYWTRLEGERSTNSSSVRIKIPKEQLFDMQAVKDLLQFDWNTVSVSGTVQRKGSRWYLSEPQDFQIIH